MVGIAGNTLGLTDLIALDVLLKIKLETNFNILCMKWASEIDVPDLLINKTGLVKASVIILIKRVLINTYTYYGYNYTAQSNTSNVTLNKQINLASVLNKLN